MPSISRISLFCCLILLIVSCQTNSGTFRNIDYSINQGEFDRGVDSIIWGQQASPPLYPARNAVSLHLDLGLLKHYAGRYNDSSWDLQEAERLIAEAFTRSISGEMTSYILNDNVKEYPGEDYEDIYINIFNALNYYHNNDLEGAMVEIRKLTLSSGKLDMLSRKYEGSRLSVGNWVLAQLRLIGIEVNPNMPRGNPVNFSDSVLARYLGGLFYLGQGNMDSARIEFERIPAAFASNPRVYSNPIPRAVSDAQNVPQGMARLNVIAFTGLSPVKTEGRFDTFFPFFNNFPLHFVQLRLPILERRPSRINRLEVIVNGDIDGNRFELELLEDMGAVIEETFNARFGNMFLKTYVRVLLKYAAADIAATELENRHHPITAFMSALTARLGIAATEAADIRMSRFLPNKAYIGGINLEPGTYSVIINYYNGPRLIAGDEQRDIIVRANQLNLIQGVSLR